MDFLRKYFNRLFTVSKDKKYLGQGIITNRENLILPDRFYIGRDFEIHARGGILIEKDVIISNRVTIHSSNHKFENASYYPYGAETITKSVVIKQGTWIGDNVMICPGVIIGKGVVVGMGSVVTNSVPDFAIIGGNPAKIIRYRNDIDSFRKMMKNEEFSYLLNKNRGHIINIELKGDNNREL